MFRGTTPTNTFTTNLDLSTAEVIYITYQQNGQDIIEKNINDITFGEGSLSVELTQEDTLKLSDREVLIQIRAKFPNGKAVASNIIKTPAEMILKDGVI